MDLLWEGLKQAVIFLKDPEIWRITLLTLQVSFTAVFLALILGLPTGIFLGLTHFPGRRVIVALVNTGMGLPPVVVGLFVSIFLWRGGPLGFLELLYTPLAMVIAQLIIAVPIIIGLTLAAIEQLNPKLRLQALTLGASRRQLIWFLLRETRLSTLAAIMAGFGGVISEVGAVLMVGGNIKGQTRVLTTAILLETRKGSFDLAIALSIVLLALAFGINLILTHIQQRGALPWIGRSWK